MVFNVGYITTSGAYDVSYNDVSGSYVSDIGITKYSANGTTRIYATYLGGNSYDVPHSLIVDPNNRLIVLGTTSSTNFPTTSNAFQKNHAGGPAINTNSSNNVVSLNGLGLEYPNGIDISITKFNAAGTAIAASTYYGGNGSDGIGMSIDLVKNYGDGIRGEILLDKLGNIIIASCSNSTDLTTHSTSKYKTNSGGYDGIIAKFNTNLSSLLAFTYIGGAGDDAVYDANLNQNNELIVAGGTVSSNLPVSSNAFIKAYQGKTDGFISKFDNNLSSLLSSSYYGTNDYDQIYFVESDKQNNIYVLGQTSISTGNFYILNASYSNGNKGQFISKFNTNLNSRIQSTTFGANGSNPDISPTAFLVDYCDQIFVGGFGSKLGTFNTFQLSIDDLPVSSDAFQSTFVKNCGFYFMSISTNMTQLLYGTYFGGKNDASEEHVDGGTSRFDKNGTLYHAICAGCKGQNNFPIYPNVNSVVAGTNGNAPKGNCNMGVVKFDIGKAVVANYTTNVICAPGTVNFKNLSYTIGPNPTYNWTFSTGATSTLKNPTLTINTPGTYSATLIVTDPISCNFTDTFKSEFVVLGNTKTILPPKLICPGGTVQIGIDNLSDEKVSISWSPSNTLDDAYLATPYASPLVSTEYIALVTTGNCTDTFTQWVNVEVPSPLAIIGPNKSCLNVNFNLNATSYNTGTYAWSNTGLVSSNREIATYNFSSLPETIEVSYISEKGCLSKAILQIEEGSGAFNITGDSIVCPNKNATITVNKLTGATYKWSTGETSNSISKNISLTTTFYLTATESNGCVAKLLFQVKALDTFELKFKNLNPINCKFDTLILWVEYLPLTNFVWSPNNVIISGQGTNSIKAFITENTVFTISANLISDNCLVSRSVEIIKDTNWVKITAPKLFCRNDTIILSANYNSNFNYNWIPSNFISQNKNTVNYKFIDDKTYYCKINVNNTICEYIDSAVVSRIKLLDDLEVSANPPKVEFGKSSQLIAQSDNAITYLWSPAKFVNYTTIYNPITSHDTTMTFYVTVSDSMHCKSSDSIIVPIYYEICDAPEVYIPNTFTPNGDTKNDILFVRGDNIQIMHLSIYDRWGQLMFESNNKESGWDGTYKGKEMEPGVYAYILHVTCRGGAKNVLSGNITILK